MSAARDGLPDPALPPQERCPPPAPGAECASAGACDEAIPHAGLPAALRRGPRATTRTHPAGLTQREAEVLGLVAAGLRNAEIAERLYLTPKTVSHHLSAIYSKLGVETRIEAAQAAAQLGIAPS